MVHPYILHLRSSLLASHAPPIQRGANVMPLSPFSRASVSVPPRKPLRSEVGIGGREAYHLRLFVKEVDVLLTEMISGSVNCLRPTTLHHPYIIRFHLRESDLHRRTPGPSPLDHRDDCSRSALCHGSLNSRFPGSIISSGHEAHCPGMGSLPTVSEYARRCAIWFLCG